MSKKSPNDDAALEPDADLLLEEDREPTAVSRFGLGINVLLQISLAVVLFFLANYLGYRHYERWDQSSANDFTLSGVSSNVIRSLPETLPEPVEMIVTFASGSEIHTEVTALAEEYRRQSDGSIILSHVDPVRQSDAAEEIKNQHGIELQSNSVILLSGDQSRVVTDHEMFFTDPDRIKQDREVTFHGEDAITSALISFAEDSRRVLYLVADRSDVTDGRHGSSVDLMADFGARHNAEVRILVLSESQTIPEDADGLLFLRPRYDFSESDVDLLTRYWEGDRGSLLFLLDPADATPRLDAFLADNGVRRQPNRVLYAESTGTGSVKHYEVEALVLGGTPVGERLPAHVVNLSGQTQSLRLDTTNPRLADHNIEVLPLLQAASRYWGEVDFLDKLPTIGPDDHRAPVHLAASVEFGAVDDARIGIESSRMVIVGNANLINPETTVPANVDFFSAALNWMLDRDELIGIPPKVKTRHRLYINQRQSERIFQIIAMGLPAAVLAFGFFVWTLRRG